MKRIALPLIALLLLAGSAFAVDGTVLINQNTVVNGLPGCPTGGSWPIIICKSGSYRLSGNLTTSSSADAIDVTADNVSLDLNGFTISGPVVCSGGTATAAPSSCSTNIFNTGVFVNADGGTIRNGTVTGFWAGVTAQGSGALVEEIHATGNWSGISISTGMVRRNIVTNNFDLGISLSSAGSILDNTVIANRETGITAYGATVANNACSYNGNYGILAVAGSTVLANSVSNNGAWGLRILNSLFGSNTFYKNTYGDFQNSGSVSQQNNMCGSGTC